MFSTNVLSTCTGGWSTTTTKCVCQKGLQKTWATSTFTIDCLAVKLNLPPTSTMQPLKEPQSSEDWHTTLITAAAETMEITSQTSCSPYCDVIQGATRNTGQKGKAMCFLCICVMSCFKCIFQCLCLRKDIFLTVEIQRDVCNFHFWSALYTK